MSRNLPKIIFWASVALLAGSLAGSYFFRRNNPIDQMYQSATQSLESLAQGEEYQEFTHRGSTTYSIHNDLVQPLDNILTYVCQEIAQEENPHFKPNYDEIPEPVIYCAWRAAADQDFNPNPEGKFTFFQSLPPSQWKKQLENLPERIRSRYPRFKQKYGK